jgi:HEAT repeat protein
MGLFDNYRIKKSIDTLLTARDCTSPAVVKAAAKLEQIGQPALLKLIEALGAARNRESIVSVLTTMLQNNTLPIFMEALTHAPSRRVEAGMLEVMIRGGKYDPNKLLGLFTNPQVPRKHLEKVLIHHKQKLQPEALLRLFTMAGKGEYEAVFHLIEQVTTEAFVPELIHRLRTDDATLRYKIAQLLCRFNTCAVWDALVKLLADPHKEVRYSALQGLIAMRKPLDLEALCRLLQDSEDKIRHKALDVLLENLQHESEEVRQRVVEGLSATGNITASAIRDLLQALKGKDWWVTARVADTLGVYGGVRIVEIILDLLRDADPFIRQCAFEILQTMKDEQTFNLLVEALKDKEIREHAVEALAAMGDKRAMEVFVNMLEGDTEISLIAIRALVALGDPQAVRPLLAQLQCQDKATHQEILRALAVLTNEAHAPSVMQVIMSMRHGDDEDMKQLANHMATNLIKRFGQKVMPRSTVQEGPEEAPEVAVVIGGPAAPGRSDAGQRVMTGGQASTQAIDVATLEPGAVLGGRYRVIGRVGHGGFSTVFLVEDTMVHENVILKILNSQVALDDNMIKRFIHELRYARKVTHENVIRIYDFTVLGQYYAISMEYFPGHSLDQEIQDGTLSIKRGIKIIWDVCRGVGAAHQADIVHRDLKPPNILINDQGVVKIVDFGVAVITSDMSTRLTKVGTVLGTPTYMAPEQVRSHAIDARTDIYSLGVIMYEMFTGRPPYVGEDMSVLFQVVEGNCVPPRQTNPDLPPALEEIILKAMAAEPEQRFQNVDELRKDLMRVIRRK